MMQNRINKIAFADQSVKTAFDNLNSGKFEDKQLHAYLERAIMDLKENPRIGVGLHQKQWPKEYVKKYAINNLRKYDLPNGWRLIYTLKGNQIEIVSILIEWFTHKEYERRFHYKKHW